MRTLKKTLALVLVVAMMMSLCITSNAAFTDADEIEYVEAVEVMTAIGVIDGFPSGEFQPQGSLTRAQAAKILVYLLGEEAYAKADGQIFDDVPEYHWAADYIAYCAENGLVNGYGDGKFGPEDKLTGYQWAKMLLAALGVDTTEMIGAAWQIPVAQAAANYGIFAENEKADKTEICTREEACLYALNAAKIGVSVKYAVVLNGKEVGLYGTLTEASLAAIALGPQYDVEKKVSNASLLYTMHGVIYDSYQDDWGRPGVCYYNEKGTIGLVYLDTPDAVYTTAVTECDIATDVKLNKNTDYVLYTNGADSYYQVQPTDTVQTIGAQGTLVEVYGKDIIVVIDTMLAMVLDVTDITYDKAGHQTAPATITLAVFNDGTDSYQVVKDSNKYANYEYSAYDMVLVNAYTENDVNLTTGDVTVGIVATDRSSYAEHIEILGLAKSAVGAQTFLWYNAPRHTIDGVDYYDAKWFELDEAGTSTADHVWYFDQYGNVIGSVEIATVYAYGIIEDIQWINPVGAAGYAQATIRYMDNTTETKVVASIDGLPTAYAGYYGVGEIQASAVAVSTVYDNNTALCGDHLYRIETLWNGTLALTHVATYNAAGALVEYNEITKADIIGGKSAITGTNGPAYTNNNTVYLIQTVSGGKVSYSVVTGYQNVADYTESDDVVVDWVNIDADPYADYVYVTGTPDNAYGASLFFRTGASVKAVLGVNGGISYYEVTGILDGVADQTIKVAASLVPAGATIDDVIPMGVLLGVTSTNGKVDGTVALEDGDHLGAELNSVAYWGLYLDIKGMGAASTYDGEVLFVDAATDAYYNVVGLDTTYGEWSYNLTNKGLYVIHDAYENAYSVYVLSSGASEDPSGEGEPVKGTTGVRYIVNFYDKVGGTVNAQLSYLETSTAAGTYAYGSDYFAADILELVGATASAWEVSYCTPVVVVYDGYISYIMLNVYPAAEVQPAA